MGEGRVGERERERIKKGGNETGQLHP